mmetsp:Transcript_35214/g.77093  ORF Transcript_35214/g.77093 Transcript_35214/m.77093 type:complete len:707 (+) Transcript_35214:20-2140(+)
MSCEGLSMHRITPTMANKSAKKGRGSTAAAVTTAKGGKKTKKGAAAAVERKMSKPSRSSNASIRSESRKNTSRSSRSKRRPIDEDEREVDEEEEVDDQYNGTSDSSDSEDDADDSDDSHREGKKGSNKFFSDENADWLKPKSKKPQKQQLMSSSDDDSDGDDDDEFAAKDDYDESDASGDASDDSDELLEVERQSRLIDREMELEEAEAEEEYRRTIAQSTAVFHLPTLEELEDDEDRVVPPTELRERIDAILEVLADFKSRREQGRSRSDYVDQLQSDMAELFGYLPELVEHFLSMFGPAETLEFLTASDSPRPLVIRTNTLKARRKDLAAALLKRGVTLDPLASWSKVGLKISESPVPVGATPEYLSGHYMLQSAASMCPVMALSPQPNERVLDMSAAPGGKTSYLAQLMRNTGSIVANDLKPDRQKATVANMHRLGVRNVITCAYDGRKLGKLWPNKFDKVLLDAPCSGLGVISRDPSVKVQRTMADVHRTVVLQKEILLSAIDALSYKRGGGYVVYSTCSVSVAENEEVVNYVLGKRDVKLVDAGLDFGKPGFTRYQHKRFHPSLALTRRFYPHVHNFDGFYVAKLKKLSDKRPGEDEKIYPASAEETADADEAGSDNEVAAREKKSTSKKERQGAATKKATAREEERKKRVSGESNSEEKPAKKAKNSVPPSVTHQSGSKKKRKQANNAKVTKPRRMKLGM